MSKLAITKKQQKENKNYCDVFPIYERRYCKQNSQLTNKYIHIYLQTSKKATLKIIIFSSFCTPNEIRYINSLVDTECKRNHRNKMNVNTYLEYRLRLPTLGFT